MPTDRCGNVVDRNEMEQKGEKKLKQEGLYTEID